MPTDHRGRAAHLLVLAGAAALVGSMFLHWVGRGSGSTLALSDVGDLVLGGTVHSVVPTWVGLLVYLVPGSGALILLAAGVDSPRSRPVIATLVALAASLVTVATVGPLLRHVRPGPGQAVAGLGVVLALVGLLVGVRNARR